MLSKERRADMRVRVEDESTSAESLRVFADVCLDALDEAEACAEKAEAALANIRHELDEQIAQAEQCYAEERAKGSNGLALGYAHGERDGLRGLRASIETLVGKKT